MANTIKSLETEIQGLHDDIEELHKVLGRVVETICAWDHQLAGGFNLLRGQISHFSRQGGGSSSNPGSSRSPGTDGMHGHGGTHGRDGGDAPPTDG